MSRFIDADKLIACIKERECAHCNDYNGIRCRACATDDAIYQIDNAPDADAVEVVRCKTCKHWDSSIEGRYFGGWCFCDKLQFSTSPDWYCADGEMKTNAVD